MELVTFEHLSAVLKEMAADIGENYASVIDRNKHNASRQLSLAATDIMNQHVTAESDGMVISFDLPTYWKYIEKGTAPHWPPPQALIQWIEIKPVIPRAGSNGRIPTTKQLAFLIGRKIATVGTKGTEDLATARERTVPWWRSRIEEALQADLHEYIIKQAPVKITFKQY